MKQIGIFFTVFLLICLAGIYYLFDTPKENGEKGFRVAAVIPSETEIFWKGVWTGVENGADRYGIQLSKYEYDTSAEEEEMTDKLETAILSKVDGILLSSNQYSTQKTQELLSRAREMGIKVVLCDSDTDETMRDAFVGIDNTEAGNLGAEKLLETEEIQKVQLIYKREERLSSASLKRRSALEDTLSQNSDKIKIEKIQLVETSEEYYQGLQDLLLSDEEGNAVVCFNSASTLLMAQTIERLGMEERILMLGFCESEEAFQYVENGVIDILLTQDNKGLGEKGMEVLRRLLNGEELETDIYHVDTTVVTANGEKKEYGMESR